MARSKVMLAVGIGLLALILGVAMPMLISSTTTDTTESVILDVNESTDLTDTLEIRLDAVETSSNETNNATVSVTNLRDYETSSVTINDTESDTVSLSGSDIDVSVDLRTADSALIGVDYPPTFGWDESAVMLVENLDVIMVVVTIVIIFALLGVRI